MKFCGATAVLVVDGQPVVGRQAIRIAFEGFLSRRARMTLKTRSVIKSEEGLAVLHGDWVLEPVLADEIGTTTRGLSTEVIRRQPDGTWRFVIDNPHTPQSKPSCRVDRSRVLRKV